MDLFVSFKNVGKFYKDASSLKKICLEKEQGARTLTQNKNVPVDNEIDVGTATLRVLGATAATAATAGFGVYKYWKNYDRIKLRKVYKKLLNDIVKAKYYQDLLEIEKEIRSNPTLNLKQLYGEFPTTMFPQSVIATTSDVNVNKVIQSLNNIQQLLIDTYNLKYARLNFCKIPSNIIAYKRIKDDTIMVAIYNTVSTAGTASPSPEENSKTFINNYKKILNILIGETYEALAGCSYGDIFNE